MAEDKLETLVQEHAEEQHNKVLWAPALANTAALVAFSSFIGGSSHPDFTFSKLQVAIVCFVFGMISAGVAMLLEHFYTTRSLRFLGVSSALGNANEEIEKAHADTVAFAPNRAALAIVLGDEEVDKKIKGMWAWYEKKYELARKRLDEKEADLKAARKKLNSIDLNWKMVWVTVIFAHVCFGVGIGYAVIGHMYGIVQFEPSASDNIRQDKTRDGHR